MVRHHLASSDLFRIWEMRDSAVVATKINIPLLAREKEKKIMVVPTCSPKNVLQRSKVPQVSCSKRHSWHDAKRNAFDSRSIHS